MVKSQAGAIRYNFLTQLPRDDGCGVFVLQMLTDRSYDELAGMIDWSGRQAHYTTWKEITGVLSELGWQMGMVQPASHWDDIDALAVVHVAEDHFTLYDGENGVHYDPAEPEGPALASNRIPLSYLVVGPPAGAR